MDYYKSEPGVLTYIEKKECAFCGRTSSLNEIQGRQICASCWEIVAEIAMRAFEHAVRNNLHRIVNGE